MAISIYDTFKVWDAKAVVAGDVSEEIYVDIAEVLGVYFKMTVSIDIILEGYIKDQWLEVYRWTSPGTAWVHDSFALPMASKVRLKATGATTITAYFDVKR